jgi:hypothetical protein
LSLVLLASSGRLVPTSVPQPMPSVRLLNGEQREPSIEHETMGPQEMIDGLVQVLREVYANDTFRTLRCTTRS